MDDLQIKNENFPQRCEICHQSDCFDPKTNFCSRCAEIKIKPESIYCKNPIFIDAVNDARFVKTFGIISLVSSVLVFLGAYFGLGLGLTVFGYGKSKFYRRLGLIIAIMAFATAIGPLIGILSLS